MDLIAKLLINWKKRTARFCNTIGRRAVCFPLLWSENGTVAALTISPLQERVMKLNATATARS